MSKRKTHALPHCLFGSKRWHSCHVTQSFVGHVEEGLWGVTTVTVSKHFQHVQWKMCRGSHHKCHCHKAICTEKVVWSIPSQPSLSQSCFDRKHGVWSLPSQLSLSQYNFHRVHLEYVPSHTVTMNFWELLGPCLHVTVEGLTCDGREPARDSIVTAQCCITLIRKGLWNVATVASHSHLHCNMCKFIRHKHHRHKAISTQKGTREGCLEHTCTPGRWVKEGRAMRRHNCHCHKAFSQERMCGAYCRSRHCHNTISRDGLIVGLPVDH